MRVEKRVFLRSIKTSLVKCNIIESEKKQGWEGLETDRDRDRPTETESQTDVQKREWRE